MVTVIEVKKMNRLTVISKRVIAIIIISILILVSLNISTTDIKSVKEDCKISKPLNLALTPHDPIEIISDDNFTDYGFDGKGSDVDPYIIEDYNITTSSEKGIYVNSTTMYFVIRNCYIDAEKYGVCIDNVAEGTATIKNNTCTNNNYYGIYLRSSSNSTLTNNTCTNNDNVGIRLWYSSNSTLTNNTCTNNNDRGFNLFRSSGTTLTNNSCYNDGFDFSETSVEAYLTYVVENNWVNEKKFGFYINLDKTTLSESLYGQLFLINCTEIVVCNQELSNTSIGLYLQWCENFTLTNNTCTNNFHGIMLYASSGSTLTNNTCTNNDNIGICLDTSSNSTLTNNTCKNTIYDGIMLYHSFNSTLTHNTCTNNNFHGISLSGSSGSTLTNNTCTNNEYSISLSGSSNSTLTHNTCTNNEYGISLSGSSNSTLTHNTCSNNEYGIYLRSSNSTLTHNTCSNNYYGIYLYGSDSCLFTYNLLQENEEYGIFIRSDSDYNIIHHNTFVNNNLGGTSQAYDEGSNNIWYDTETNEGNYWSDWSGIGSYSIDGLAGSVDPYPLDGPPVFSEFLQINTFTMTLFLCLALVFLLLKKRRKIN